jgi:hypothetical protein
VPLLPHTVHPAQGLTLRATSGVEMAMSSHLKTVD